jgi:putative flavoprotein involved in K+ transport
MLSLDQAQALEHWLQAFNESLRQPDPARIASLLLEDSHWRDAVALTGELRTVSGGQAIAGVLAAALARLEVGPFEVDPARCPPRVVDRVGVRAIEAMLRFRTRIGVCAAVVRLPAAGPTLAWTVHTALQGIHGHDEATVRAAREEPVFDRHFDGPSWLDRRTRRHRFEDREPTVLIVGGGHGGLSVAARLGQIGIDALVVDREARIGDNWRLRYRALRLHNTFHSNHLPYLPFPATWQPYLPKDRVANWLETYVDSLDIAFWTQTAFAGAERDESAGRWVARVRRSDGNVRTLYPRHIVMATGVSGVPKRPKVPTLERFSGPVLHTSEFSDGQAWKGRHVLILGTGTSAHDVAQDLHSHGAHATLIQRSPTLVIQVEPSAQLYDALFLGEGPSLEDRDLILTSIPKAVMLESHRRLTREAEALDATLLDGLRRIGFKLTSGVDGTGWPYLFRTRGGGYYFNVGCSDLLVRGEVGLTQYDQIESFVAEGVRMKDGRLLPADLVVLATGYEGHDHTVRTLFGAAVAERVGQIWGFDPETQELASMWTRTGQPGLWFTGGPFSLCRAYSRYLALQIQAEELGHDFS